MYKLKYRNLIQDGSNIQVEGVNQIVRGPVRDWGLYHRRKEIRNAWMVKYQTVQYIIVQ